MEVYFFLDLGFRLSEICEHMELVRCMLGYLLAAPKNVESGYRKFSPVHSWSADDPDGTGGNKGSPGIM